MSAPTWVIARWEYRRAVRSRALLVTAGIFGLLTAAVTLVALATVRDLGLSGVGPASASLVNLAVLVPSLMGIVVGAASLLGAGDAGLVASIAAQPIRRSSLPVGAVLGLTGALWTTLAVGLGVALVLIGGAADATDVSALVTLVGTTAGVVAASVSIGVVVAVAASTRVQAISTSVAVWIAMALGVDLAIAALAPSIHLGPTWLLLTILLDPIECGRVLALLGTDLEGTALGPFGAYVLDRFGIVGSIGVLGGALVAWIVLPLAIAGIAIGRKDLR
jgi:ABC-type transport system involved in multi-copper enzyme maturation permease subunit